MRLPARWSRRRLQAIPAVHRGMRGRRELAAGHDRRRRVSSYPGQKQTDPRGYRAVGLCMALTRITLLLAEIMLRHLLLAGGSVHAHWQDVAAAAGGGHCSPCRVAAGESTEPAQRQRQYRPYAGSEPAETDVDIIDMLVLLLVGVVSRWQPVALSACCVRRLGTLWLDQRNVCRSACAGGHADADGRCTRTRAGLPGDARRRSAGADRQSLLCLAGKSKDGICAGHFHHPCPGRSCAVITPYGGDPAVARAADRLAGRTRAIIMY